MSPAGKVEFLVAGVQKGGTSALFEYLRDVPALQLPDVKEAHFFDDEETIDWCQPDYGPYHQLFVNDGRLWGEATPIYLYWPNSLERIHTYNPAMKIIVLLREPIARAWSHWQMEYAKGKERAPFAWCIREGRNRLATGDPAAPGHHRVFSYVERGFYAAQIERLFRLFPRTQCLILSSEDLRDEPAAAIGRICTFLGVDPPAVRIAPKLVHSARDIDYPSTLEGADRALLTSIYQSQLLQLRDMLGTECPPWAKK